MKQMPGKYFERSLERLQVIGHMIEGGESERWGQLMHTKHCETKPLRQHSGLHGAHFFVGDVYSDVSWDAGRPGKLSYCRYNSQSYQLLI